jgi:hypothetical protein
MLRRLMIAWTFALVAQALIAQVGVPAAPPETAKKPPGNCTVRGRVVSATDGAPLRSARVGLIEVGERSHPQMYAATTSDDGTFEIKQIQAGRYNFFAAHIGYLEQRYQAKGTERNDGAMMSLLPGQEVSDVMFRLVRAGVITGKVVDDSGEPMAGVNVSVLRTPTEAELEDAGTHANRLEMRSVSIARTDDRGEYRLFGLKPGEYYIKATDTGGERFIPGTMETGHLMTLARGLGSRFAPIYYPGVLQLDQAQTVALQAGEEMQADFAMRQITHVEVAGRVIGPDGAPASRAYVSLQQRGVSDWTSGLGAGTDSKGEFSIKGVPQGSYFITAGVFEAGKTQQTRQRLDVGESNIDSLRFYLGAGASIHGRVVTTSGAPLSTAHIEVVLIPANDESSTESGFTEVKKDGSFELEGIADGGYSANAFGMEPGWFVKSIHLGNEDVLQKGAQVENGAVGGSLDIVVSAEGAQIEGTVTDSDKNQPLMGAQVKIVPDPMTDYNEIRMNSTSTDQNGHYVLSNVPPGKYKVSAKLASPAPGSAPIKSDPVAVSVAEREHRTVDIKLAVPKSE